MCGISGWFRISGPSPEESTLHRMLDAINHRGPNERGLHCQDDVALGMTRLSINDVEGGQQPYFSEDQRVVAVFNGEIYNFQELKTELQERGHQFRSQTDGEVIVHLYEEFGIDFVHKLNGMFAIALFDGEHLYLLRDRFGIKPLYYTEVDSVLYFASELKCLLEIPGFQRRLNHSALRSYLCLEYVPSPHSIYSGVQKLSPGHRLRIRNSGVETPERYWSLPRLGGETGCMQEWAEDLRESLKSSVKKRLLSDVPLGVFLSGGLDSSSLTALMTELSPGQVKSFSVGFCEKSFDESSFSRLVAEHLGTEHHEEILDPQTTLAVLDPLYQSLDEPMADAAIIPTYLLSRFASQEVTVCLAGEGADELLAGYPTYLAHQLSQPFRYLPPFLIKQVQRLAQSLPTSRKYLSLDFKIKRFCSGLGLDDAERHLTWMGSIPWAQTENFLLEPAVNAYHLPEFEASLGLVERIQTLDFATYLSEGLLVKLDRASMLHSLEARVPFLDHELVKKMAALPTRHKFRLLDAKRVLKQAIGPQLPPEILKRKKKGFGIPVSDWLRGPLKFLMDEFLAPEYLRSQGLFRVDPIVRLVREHLDGKQDHRKPLWTLLVFQRWWNQNRPT